MNLISNQIYLLVSKHFIIIGIIFVVLCGCKNQDLGTLTNTGQPRFSKEMAQAIVRPFPKATGNSSEHSPNIRIAVVSCLSGMLSPWGNEALRAIKLATEQFNQKGGAHGKKVTLLVGDSASNPEQGKNAATKLIAEGAIGIVGDLTSGISAQMAKSAFDNGVPLITIGGTRKDLTDIGANIFRACYTDNFQGPLMAKFAYDELCLRRVALFTDRKQPYSIGLSEGFRHRFEKLGGEIVDEQFYETGQTQFSAQLTSIKARNPDGLFVGGYYPEVGPLIRQAKTLGLDVYKLGADGWDSDQILTSGGEAILGGYYCTHYSLLEPRKEVIEFTQLWKNRYHSAPTAITAALAYDAMLLMLDALKRSNRLDSRALMESIENTEKLHGVTGTYTLKNHHGNPAKRAIILTLTPKGSVFQKSYENHEIMDF